MKYHDISHYIPVNKVDPAHVRELADNIKANGWQGMPILVCNARDGSLVTGSHRLAALHLLKEENWDMNLDALGDIAEDVTEYVDRWCESEDETFDRFPHDDLRRVFKDTWVERYADELEEW